MESFGLTVVEDIHCDYSKVLITAIAIWSTYAFDIDFASFDILKISFLVVGIILIIFGFI